MSAGKRIIAERQKTHGSFSKNAAIAQVIKVVMRGSPRWHDMTAQQQEALDLVATKIGRICAGDSQEPDHWKDGSGYFELGLESIRTSNRR